MNKERKERFEKRFKEYCKFDKCHIANKSRFEAIFKSWNESKSFLSVEFTEDVACAELEYFKSLGWELVCSYNTGLIFKFTVCIFKAGRSSDLK